jgi:predicted house-cleaning NTP pyrophosphatase (Maf/HAM1 superfamily)
LYLVNWSAAKKAVETDDTNGVLVFAEQLLSVVGRIYPPALKAEKAVEVLALLNSLTTDFGKPASVEQMETIHPLPDGN